jgi:uncharacterized protein (DUF2141 family)
MKLLAKTGLDQLSWLAWRLLLCAAVIAVSLIVLNCANDEAPPGGPPDTTPPQVLASIPSNGDIGIAVDSRIEIQFSERVDQSTTSNAVFISPPLVSEPRIRVKASRVLIEPSAPLDSNRTYVVTIGSSASDIHNNQMSTSWSMAFSTGSMIDSGSIKGVVYQDLKPKRNFSVFAYQKSDDLFDSIFNRRPDYITQTGDTGNFTLSYLRAGTYLVLGVEDKDRDDLINGSSERVALPTEYITASRPGETPKSYSFYVTQYDSSYLELLHCSGMEGAITMRFTGGQLDPASLSIDSIALTTDSGAAIPISAVMIPPNQPDQVSIWSTRLVLDSSFTATVRGLVNTAGRSVDSAVARCNVRISTVDDVPPQVVGSNPGQGRVVIAPEDSLKVIYSEPVTFDGQAAFVPLDSVSYDYLTPLASEGNTYSFALDSMLLPGVQYRFFIDQKKVRDWFGNTPEDSLYSFAFMIASDDSLGTLIGQIISDPGTPLVINFQGLRNKLSYSLKQSGSGPFDIKLYPDQYQVTAFADLNGDDKWELGSLSPFGFAEPGWVEPDTIRIRARFEHSGYQFEFR